jgi:hypothetical protein
VIWHGKDIMRIWTTLLFYRTSKEIAIELDIIRFVKKLSIDTKYNYEALIYECTYRYANYAKSNGKLCAFLSCIISQKAKKYTCLIVIVAETIF